MPRTVITRQMIDDMIAEGRTEYLLPPGAIVTALAAEHAQDRGLRLDPSAQRSTAAPTPSAPAPAPAAVETDAGERARVRSAVIAALGTAPAGLDAAIDRVLKG